MAGPRTGRPPTVVVTRAADQAGALADLLRQAGFDVIEVPVVAIAEPADGGAALAAALADLGRYEWLVVTSPNGAARVAEALAAWPVGRRPKVAAVGPGTAAALGTPVDLVATRSVGEGLVADFPEAGGAGGHDHGVLLVQAEASRAVVAQGLTAKGWRVEAVVGYRTVPAVPPPAAVAALARADAVAFTSGSTVRGFVAAVGRDWVPPVVVSIGPQTSLVAAELGIEVTVTADPHTLPGVVDALRRALETTPGGRVR